MSAFTGDDPMQIHHSPRDPKFLLELPEGVQVLDLGANYQAPGIAFLRLWCIDVHRRRSGLSVRGTAHANTEHVFTTRLRQRAPYVAWRRPSAIAACGSPRSDIRATGRDQSILVVVFLFAAFSATRGQTGEHHHRHCGTRHYA
jgi:hypothetical protein